MRFLIFFIFNHPNVQDFVLIDLLMPCAQTRQLQLKRRAESVSSVKPRSVNNKTRGYKWINCQIRILFELENRLSTIRQFAAEKY